MIETNRINKAKADIKRALKIKIVLVLKWKHYKFVWKF